MHWLVLNLEQDSKMLLQDGYRYFMHQYIQCKPKTLDALLLDLFYTFLSHVFYISQQSYCNFNGKHFKIPILVTSTLFFARKMPWI